MNLISIHRTLIIIFLTGIIASIFAQETEVIIDKNKGWFWGINAGANVFWGDIKLDSIWQSAKMQEIQASGGIVFGRKISPSLNFSTELNYTSLRGNKIVLPDTLYFKTQALNFALKWQLNLMALIGKQDAKFAFYIESGAGIMAWRSLLQNVIAGDTISNLGWSNPDREFSYYIPGGVKLQYRVSPRLSTYFTTNYNLVFNDLLDGHQTGGKYDTYSYSALGINYHLGKKNTIPKLLPYAYFEKSYDSLTTQASSKKTEATAEAEIEEAKNPFLLNFDIPETAPHTALEIAIKISKKGIPANGFFRLIVPSGFIPQPTNNTDIVFTKLGYRYEYDFIFPSTRDSINIPIQIKLSEIEKGLYPILIEGEIIDQRGNVFPIKSVTYTQIISESEWYQGLPIKKQKEIDLKKLEDIDTVLTTQKSTNQNIQKTDEKPRLSENKKIESQKQIVKVGEYRIQIMASKNQYANIEAFKTQHNITQKVFESHGDGWYRYNLYSTQDLNEAHRLCTKVRSENKIPEAFVTYYENGKRIVSKRTAGNSSGSKITPKTISKQNQAQTDNRLLSDNLLYRIEIAKAYDQPIPLYLLNNKVGKERITEFKQDNVYYYTVGEFEDLSVAKAFLEYVKTQFNIENPKLGQYQKDQRIKAVY